MIEWRPNKTGTTLAAYRGSCRVGYVTCRTSTEWLWELGLLRPTGGHYIGVAHAVEDAKRELENAFREWMVHARLQEMKE